LFGDTVVYISIRFIVGVSRAGIGYALCGIFGKSDDEELQLNEARHRNGAWRFIRMEDSESAEDLDEDDIKEKSLILLRQLLSCHPYP